MNDIFYAVIFMSLIFGLAAAILWFVDRRTFAREASEEERKAIAERRTARWHGLWLKAFAVMAVVSIPLNLVGLIRRTEPVLPTAIWIVFAVLFSLGFWNSFRGDDVD
jgi:heme/copper-type cytochrome/quinol oxidase subunit 1